MPGHEQLPTLFLKVPELYPIPFKDLRRGIKVLGIWDLLHNIGPY